MAAASGAVPSLDSGQSVLQRADAATEPLDLSIARVSCSSRGRGPRRNSGPGASVRSFTRPGLEAMRHCGKHGIGGVGPARQELLPKLLGFPVGSQRRQLRRRHQAQVLADATASVLPGHPDVTQSVSLRYLPGISPAATVALPVAGGRAAGRTVTLGRGHPHLVVFFATWVDENSNLTAQLRALNGYQQAARASDWPQVVAVDEASTESTPAALPALQQTAMDREMLHELLDLEDGRRAHADALTRSTSQHATVWPEPTSTKPAARCPTTSASTAHTVRRFYSDEGWSRQSIRNRSPPPGHFLLRK